ATTRNHARGDILEHFEVGLPGVIVACDTDCLDHPDAKFPRHDAGRHQPAAGDANDRFEWTGAAQPPRQRARIAMKLIPRDGEDFCGIDGLVRFGALHGLPLRFSRRLGCRPETSLPSPGAGEQQNLKRPVRCRASEFIYSPLIQSMTCRLAATAVVRWPAKISRYLLLGFLASASKGYSGPRRASGSSF